MKIQSPIYKLVIEEQQKNPAEFQVCKAIALGSRMLHLENHDDMNQGQLSARSPSDPENFFIKQVLVGFDEATPNEIIRASYVPGSQQHKLSPPEVPLHQAIYEAYPNVNAIVHTHAFYSLAFGAIQSEIEPISHEGACFQNKIAYFEETSHTILTIELGRKIAKALKECNVLFIRNHGCVIVGATIKEAVIYAILLERACKLQLLIKSLNVPYFTSPQSDIKPKQEFIFGPLSIRTFWEYYVRKVEKSFPETIQWTL